MVQGDVGRIGEQHEAYRKGVVLGLTMAEVGILIIFVLLLLLVFSQLRFAGMEAVPTGQLSQLRMADSTLHDLATQLGVGSVDSSEDFTRLVRVVTEAARTRGAQSALVRARSMLAQIRRARDEIAQVAAAGKQDGGGAVAQRVEQQGYDIANQQGQIAVMRKQLEEAGHRVGELPCWARQGGVIDYLYDIELTNQGIRMRERTYADRMRERLALPAPTVDPGETLSEAQFLEKTQALYEFSRRKDCRFFVVVYDGTGPTEKARYKSLLRAVEGHFYKLLANGPAPF